MSDLSLYNLTLRHPAPATQSILGQFTNSKKKNQDLLLINGDNIQLYKCKIETGKFELFLTQQTFSMITKVDTLRAEGSLFDLLVVTSDSGKLAILSYDINKNRFSPTTHHPFAKNGFGRLFPGEYLCATSRAIMVGAIERNKLVYRVQSVGGEATVSSPLEVKSKNLLTLQMIALETGYSNPVWCAIECDYSEYQNKPFGQDSPLLLNYYELDQGLNHVVKRRSHGGLVPGSSSYLAALPENGGVLVFCEGYVIFDTEAQRNVYSLPTRERRVDTLHTNEANGVSSDKDKEDGNADAQNANSMPNSGKTIITSHSTHISKTGFFILIQSTLGDLFKLTLEKGELEISYFDTVPPAASINILKSGFLFVNVQNKDKLTYQFESLGGGDNLSRKESLFDANMKKIDYPSESPEPSTVTNAPLHGTFAPKPLENLALVSIIETLSPIFDADITADAQMLALSSTSVKRLINGVKTNTIVESPIPLIPQQIFTTKLTKESPNDEYLVLSSSTNTLVLSIGEVIEEVEDSNLLSDQPTLQIQQVGEKSLVQIYANGIRHVKGELVTEWFPPAGIQITRCASSNEQILISLSNYELVYFEVDVDDQLVEYQDRVEYSSPVRSMCISQSNKKSFFAVVACTDETVQVVSLQPHNCLETLSLQALSSNAASILMTSSNSSYTVHIGMENGVYVRSFVDGITGAFSDTRVKYIGALPVKLSLLSNSVVLAISTRAWISYSLGDEYKYSPLLDIDLVCGASFVSSDIGTDALVGLSRENNLVIFTLGDEDEGFDPKNNLQIEKTKLRYVPRKMIVHGKYAYTMQSQYQIQSIGETDEDYIEAFGHQPLENSWASCIQVVDYSTQKTVDTFEFSNESLVSMAKLPFKRLNNNDQEYLVVGTTVGQRFMPNSFEQNFLYTFKINATKGSEPNIEFLHKTEVDGQPLAVIPFNGKLLVGTGNVLRLYDLGQKQLLRKSSSSIDYLSQITKIVHMGQDRVVVCDARSSSVVVKYDPAENHFYAFADDTIKRQVTALLPLDYDTVIGGDKFGSIFVSRLASDISRKSDQDWTLLKNADPVANGSMAKLRTQCEFYLGDIVTSFVKSSHSGGQESLLYFGLQGTIGVMVPMATKKEVDFLSTLESEMRKVFDYNFGEAIGESSSSDASRNILGKDQLKFRSQYNPVKNVVDGDFVEQFFQLTPALKIKVATLMKRTPKDIEKRLADLRSRCEY